MAKYAAAIIAACLLSAASAQRDLLATSKTQSVSIPFNPAGGKGSADIPLYAPSPSQASDAEQIHITYVNSTAVTISWATGTPINVAAVLPSNAVAGLTTTTSGAASFPVEYGTSPSALTSNATGFIATYNQIYTGMVNKTGYANGLPNWNYSSPELHHVTLTGLKPDTTYYYKVSGVSGPSSEYNFTMPPALGSFPLLLGVFADVGQSANSTTTIQRMIESQPEIITLIGDWTYADEYLTNGTDGYTGYPNNTAVGFPSPSGSFQPRWDTWFRLAQKLLSHVPIIPNTGNHELEPLYDANYFTTSAWGLDGGRQFNSYLARVPVPYQGSGGAPLYYSVNFGPVHMIVLCNYENFLVGSPQYLWLVKDLKSIDRSVTPWVVAQFHAPWYSSYTTHYKETETMRVAMEPLFYAAGVDIVLNGHLHEYERTNSVYNYTVNPCGAVHITMGDGGNLEGLYTTYIDGAAATDCPAPNKLPAYQPGPYTPSFTYNTSNPSKGYCPNAGPDENGNQPSWSAFRQPAFGHSTIEFINETHAYFEWNRNLDAGTVYEDTVYIIRERSCANFGGSPLPVAPAPAPTGAVAASSLG